MNRPHRIDIDPHAEGLQDEASAGEEDVPARCPHNLEVDGAKEKVLLPFVLFVVADADLLLALLPEFITFWKTIYRC